MRITIKTGHLMVVCASNHNQKWDKESDGVEDMRWPFCMVLGQRFERKLRQKVFNRLTIEISSSYDLPTGESGTSQSSKNFIPR